MTDAARPDPDELLSRLTAAAARAERGEVKIFFGPSAGAGKTYAMLEAARARLGEGIDVVAGVVETHGRAETKKLLEGIPMLPQRRVEHRGVTVAEFDLDAALARRPAILLLDELAHTNAPGSRHPKRWQDMEELRHAGIDVYTTLNVQHIESLSDVVAEATGIWVRETVPDSVFDNADDIELIDLPADDILKRLREGKIYLAEGENIRAADNFFRKANLITLREIALRRTAERVDAQLGAYHERAGSRAAPIAEKIIACVSADPLAAKVVRSARRMASSLKAPWIALYVEDTGWNGLGERGRLRVQAVLRQAERLGGKTVVVQGSNAAEEILAYTRKIGATKIVVGKPRRSLLRGRSRHALADRLIHQQNEVDVYVIAGRKADEATELSILRNWLPAVRPGFYASSGLIVALCTGIGVGLDPILQPSDQALIYLIGNVVVAANFGRGPAILYALISAACFNFFFVPPLYTLQIADRSYWLTLFVMLMTGMVITSYASRLRLQAIFARKRETETQMLYQMTRDLAVARGRADIAAIAARHIGDLSNADAAIWLRADAAGTAGHLERVAGILPHNDPVKEGSLVEWTMSNHDLAGQGTSTMPSSPVLYIPLSGTAGTLGVLGLMPKTTDRNFNQEEIALFRTFASLLTSALERTRSGEAAEHARIDAERERMHNLLLSSVSHDLRTPLASIMGASSSILDDDGRLPDATIRDLSRSIHQEAARLSRLVTNLLDVTSLEAGTATPRRQAYFIDELIGSALAGLSPILAGHDVTTQIAGDLPMVSIDPVLIEQVFTNLLENAAKHTDAGSRIDIAVKPEDGRVVVSIADDGLGIPAGQEKAVFDKFFTLANAKGRKGTGLGLAISQAIVQLHGGRIEAHNRPGGGAVFTFALPIADYAPPEADE